MSLTALRKIQIGKESVKGTAVPATAALLGQLTMKEAPTILRPKEERGTLAANTRSVKAGNLAQLSFKGDATFEQILYFLSMGVLGAVTATGAGDAKTWTFTPTMSAAGTFDSFTVEYGDDTQAYETEYCLASKITISGKMNDAVQIAVEMFGRKMSTCTFTAAITPPTVEDILAAKAKLYIDDESGTIGTTEIAGQLLSWEYVINTGLSPKRRANGSLDFYSYNEGAKGVDLKMVIDATSTLHTERTKFDGSTQRLVRINTTGGLAASPSTYKALTLDACGIWVDWSTLNEDEGNNVYEVSLSSELGSNYTKVFEVAVVNKVGTLP